MEEQDARAKNKNTKLHEQKHNESMRADITGAFFSTSVVIDANVKMSLCCSCG
jgi:hypothetical protein